MLTEPMARWSRSPARWRQDPDESGQRGAGEAVAEIGQHLEANANDDRGMTRLGAGCRGA